MSGLNGYFSTKEEELDLDKLVDRITFIPLFLTGYIFYLGSIVLISIIFPLYPAIVLLFVALLSTFYATTLRLLKDLWQSTNQFVTSEPPKIHDLRNSLFYEILRNFAFFGLITNRANCSKQSAAPSIKHLHLKKIYVSQNH